MPNPACLKINTDTVVLYGRLAPPEPAEPPTLGGLQNGRKFSDGGV